MENNINEQNKNVKKKFIKPAFSESDYRDDDWPSLEQIIEEGETPRDAGNEKGGDYRIKVSSPELPKSLLLYLLHKHRRLTGVSANSRFVSKAGFIPFEKIDGLKTVEENFKRAVELGSERDRLAFLNEPYVLGQKLGISRHQITLRFYQWVHGGIVKWSHILGLPTTTVAIVVLTFGFASSTDLVPVKHRETFKSEAERFTSWVKHRSLIETAY